ncbi:MAG: hypothetical protein ACJA01_003613 [Saprospiraceae bacterium]|jgi:hypothetical protein
MKTLLYTTLILLIGLTSCRSIDKMVDEGRYDDAIHFATQKLSGKKNKKTNHIQALEEAFLKVNSIDTDRIAFLKSKNDPRLWDVIFNLYGKIEWRQNRISGFLPLTSKEGYVADFNFIDTKIAKEGAKTMALAFHYTEASTLLHNAVTSNDKILARTAYDAFNHLYKYDRNYKDANELQNQAYTLGLNHVLLKWDESVVNLAPNIFNNYNELPSHRNTWTIYHSDHPNGIALDAVSTIYLADVTITPEREIINNIIERRQLETWVDKVDRRGHVERDTAGQIIQELQIENIEAQITEITRSKEIRINGFVETTDYVSGLRIDYKNWESNVIFSSDACTFRGDRRALGDDTQKRINQKLDPFPTDYVMIEGAFVEVTEDIYSHLRRIDFNSYLSRSYAANKIEY